jgi:hypothetical protein
MSESISLEPQLIVAVSGGRDYTDANKVNEVLGKLHRERGIALIIEGGCPMKRNGGGADGLARKWAEANEVNCLTIPPKSKRFGWPACGPIRNQEMSRMRPELWVLFPGGRGTASAAEVAQQSGIETLVVKYGD